MQNSNIEWTHHTWSPWEGCMKKSPGCQHCYAEHLLDHRYGKVKWGPVGPRRRQKSTWGNLRKWDKALNGTGRRERVFIASLSDFFEDRPEVVEWRKEALDVMTSVRNLDLMVLTKDPWNIVPMIEDYCGSASEFFARNPHVWVGTSVENQEWANKRIPLLQQVPAARRFLSMEPLLGAVSLRTQQADPSKPLGLTQKMLFPLAGIHLVIVGGESGSKARPFSLAWAYSLKQQCEEAGVAFFMKQLGSRPVDVQVGYNIRDKKGGNWHEWPEDLRVRQMPQPVVVEEG